MARSLLSFPFVGLTPSIEDTFFRRLLLGLSFRLSPGSVILATLSRSRSDAQMLFRSRERVESLKRDR